MREEMSASGQPVVVRGTVARVHFSSVDWSAGKVLADDGNPVSFVGRLMVQEGDPVILRGSWKRDPKWGLQLEVKSFSFDQALSATGLATYLANSPAFRGIGPVKAKKLALACGDRFDELVRTDPAFIARAGGVSLTVAENLRLEWERRGEENAAAVFLSEFGLSNYQLKLLMQKFGNSTVALLRKNPYLAVGAVRGAGFKRIDDIAQKMGIEKTLPARIEAGVIHAVEQRANDGDCWVDSETLLGDARKLLTLDVPNADELIDRALDDVVARKELENVPIGGRFLVALPALYAMESQLAAWFDSSPGPHPKLSSLSDADLAKILAPSLNEQQRDAISLVLRHGVVLWSGGAGSGKSFTIAQLANLCDHLGLELRMAAPTGKAAKRMQELAGGRAASTIHRMLGYGRDGFPDETLEADVVIIDEVSMMDVSLAWNLFKAIDLSKTTVVLVGDHNQLPPVGPGNILRDLIDRRVVPTVILTQVVRQAGILKENSLAVLKGQVQPSAPETPGGGHPWVLSDKNPTPEHVDAYIERLFANVLEERLGADLQRDVQVLTYRKSNGICTRSLNRLIQRVVQKKRWGVDVPQTADGKAARILLNDRVIYTRNNYSLGEKGGVMNGSVGFVTAVGDKWYELEVDFEDQVVRFQTAEDASGLELAYALTVHKAQGSEFPVAIVVAHKDFAFLAHRNWLYTAVTRAKRTAILVGDSAGIRMIARKEETGKRKTFLSILDFEADTHSLCGEDEVLP